MEKWFWAQLLFMEGISWFTFYNRKIRSPFFVLIVKIIWDLHKHLHGKCIYLQCKKDWNLFHFKYCSMMYCSVWWIYWVYSDVNFSWNYYYHSLSRCFILFALFILCECRQSGLWHVNCVFLEMIFLVCKFTEMYFIMK